MIIKTFISISSNTTQALAAHFDFTSFYRGLFLVLGRSFFTARVFLVEIYYYTYMEIICCSWGPLNIVTSRIFDHVELRDAHYACQAAKTVASLLSMVTCFDNHSRPAHPHALQHQSHIQVPIRNYTSQLKHQK